MTDNNVMNNEPQVAETNATEQQPQNMTDGVVEENTPQNVIPEGFDEEIFDTESMTLKQDKVAERLKQQKSDIEKYQKQALDMRRKLSKGVDTPENVEGYKEGYVLNEKYDSALADPESDISKYVNKSMENFDKIAMDNGFTVQQANVVKDLFMQVLEDVSLVDTRSDEVKEQAKQKFLAEQRKILGDNADTIIKENASFIANYGFFDSAEKKVLQNLIKTDATGNLIVQKIRDLFGQNKIDIPVRANAEGLADDYSLAKEYYDPNTSSQRRIEIIKQREAAGRSGNLPLISA